MYQYWECFCEKTPQKLTDRKEGRKKMFYLMIDSTHFIYGYMISHMVKDHSDSER